MPERHDPLSDAYRTLRSVVSFVQADTETPDHRGGFVTLVVSPGPSDGKTSVAANLSAAFVEAGNRVVAVNTDFRRPSLSARILGAKPAPIPLPVDALSTAGVRVLLQRTAINDLGLLDLAGIDAPPGELARETARLIPEATGIADQIVVDTSPIGLTAEVLELVPSADTIVLVVRVDHTSSTSSLRSLEILKAVATSPILLVIVGDSAERTNQYYYEYRSKRSKSRWKRSKPAA
jgi:Mrp family chromosome partitioning ATPase